MVSHRELDESRLQFEREWLRLRQSLGREVGGEPRWSRGWALPVMALAAGVALVVAFKGRKGLKASN
jgi:hypothetical protein